MKSFSKKALAVAAGAVAMIALAAPASASVLIDTIKIKNAQGTWLQVAEVQVFASPSAVPVTTLFATATSAYQNNVALNGANKAIDGITNGDYYNPASIYHGNADNGTDVLTISFALTDVDQIRIFGRTDHGYGSRDTYTYELYSGSTLRGSGFLDARSGSAVLALPELSTWAMMLGGFGMMGFGLRRRQKQTMRVVYA